MCHPEVHSFSGACKYGNILTSVGTKVEFSPISLETASPLLVGKSAITTLAPCEEKNTCTMKS